MREGSLCMCERRLCLWPISPLLLVHLTLCKQEAVAPFLGGALFICLSPGTPLFLFLPLTVYQKTDVPPPAGCCVSASIQVKFDFEPTATRTTYFFLLLFL